MMFQVRDKRQKERIERETHTHTHTHTHTCGSSPELAQKSLRPEFCKGRKAVMQFLKSRLLDHHPTPPLLQNAIGAASLCDFFWWKERQHTHTHTPESLNDLLTSSLPNTNASPILPNFHRFFFPL
jgi:hypothetical protein